MAVKILTRRSTLAEWTASNPVLSTSELAHITDTGKMKIGNNVDDFNTLPYLLLADDDEFYGLDPETSNALDDELLIWNTSENTYNKMTRKDFFKKNGVHFLDTVTDAVELEDIENGYIIYLSSTDTFYKFVISGSSYTVNDKHVLASNIGVDCRFIAVGGKYVVSNIDISSGHSYMINGTQVVTNRLANVTDVPEQTSPVNGAGSGADATTFSGSECDTLRNEVSTVRTQLNELLERIRTHGLIG